MKKTLFLIGLSTILALGVNAQESNSKPKNNSENVLQAIPEVKALSEKIETAKQRVSNSVTASRNEAAQAREALSLLYADYLKELENQLNLNTGKNEMAETINKEIEATRKLTAQPLNNK